MLNQESTVTLLIPVLNERVGMAAIMPRIRPEWYDQLIVLDGGSTDGTVEYARAQGYTVISQHEPGLRLAYCEVWPHVTGDIVVTFSPDGNSLAEHIPALVAAMRQGYDMVVVSRYLDRARSEDDTLVSRCGNWLFTKIINLLFGASMTDTLVMFRAYKRELPEQLGITRRRSPLFERLVGRFISWEPQLSVRCAKRRRKVGEIPGDEPRRVEDEGRPAGFSLLPSSRIRHFRSGFACLCLFADEFIRWRQ